MKKYAEMSVDELKTEYEAQKIKYDKWCSKGLNLDMTRGKPGPDQMNLSMDLFDLISKDTGFKNKAGIDCRNYGGVDGLIELKELFSQIMEVDPEQVIVGGNSSLNMMFDTVAQAMTHGMGGKPWMLQGKIKFLCPVPGYDRHFLICEHFGIEMIPVPLLEDGPDMDLVDEIIKDPLVKGMWCVPKYSNPNGIVYSDETVRRIANMSPAADDFRVFWDNAYAVHHLYEQDEKILGIYNECLKSRNQDLVIIFTSTSKITFPGAGVAAEAASPANVARIKERTSFQTIGPDKLNQLRHAKMFPTTAELYSQMDKHAEILRPKFKTVLNGLARELNDIEIAEWTKPKGGYFISLSVQNGCAKRVVELCRNAGLVLTKAGATYPYGKDPNDSNIRIAPTFPLVDELKDATEILCVVIKLATIEKMLKSKKQNKSECF